jgi:hypothetical protein
MIVIPARIPRPRLPADDGDPTADHDRHTERDPDCAGCECEAAEAEASP